MAILVYMRIGKAWGWILIASLLFLFVAGCLLIAPLWAETDKFNSGLVAFNILFFWMYVVLLTPLQQLTRRLAFVVSGVLTLVALSRNFQTQSASISATAKGVGQFGTLVGGRSPWQR